MISLQYELAKPEIASLISTFYHFDYEGEPITELERADRAQFRFYLKGQGRYQFDDGHIAPSYPVTIIGPTTAPVLTTASRHVTVFGWGIMPIGWDALMGVHAEDFIDRAIDARDILGESIMELHAALAALPTTAEKFSLAQTAAAKIHKSGDKSGDKAAFEFTSKVDQWLTGCADPRIEELVDATGLSIRHLERMTRHYYGMPPKKLARKYRALRVANLIANGDDLDDSDLGLAFYDQPHLIREVKQFTGLTPTQLRAGHSILTDATIKGRRKMTGNVPPLISGS